VQPGAVPPGQLGQGVHRVEVSGVDLAGVGDDHRRSAVEGDQPLLEAFEVDPAHLVAAEHLDRVTAVPEHLQRLARRGVHVAAGEHRHPGQPGQPVPHGVGAVPLTPPLGGAAERGEVGEGGAADQRATPAFREAEQVPQPVEHDGLRLVREGRRDPGEGVLVEQPGGPVPGQRGRGGAAGDEVEEPRAGRGGGGGGADLEEALDGRGGAGAVLGQRAAEPGEQFGRRRVVHLPVGQRCEVRAGGRGDLSQGRGGGVPVEQRISHQLTLGVQPGARFRREER
jgi:hypothetical protein